MPDVPEGEEGQQVPEGFFTKAQLDEAIKAAKQAARGEARDQLHDRLQKSDDRFKEMKAEVDRLAAVEQDRQKAIDAAAAEAEKARKAQEDAELSSKDLIARRDQEFQAQLAEIKAQQAQALADMEARQATKDALFEKERQFAALQMYIRDQATTHANDIAPELIDMIDGNSQEEVDASVARLVEKTAQIVAGMRQAAQATRAAMPGVSPGGGTAGIVPGLDTGDKVLTDADIKGMSMKDFAALRQTVGLAARGQGQGIFG